MDQVEDTHNRVLITRNGKPAAVLMSPEDLESLEETLEILSDPAVMKRIRKARKRPRERPRERQPTEKESVCHDQQRDVRAAASQQNSLRPLPAGGAGSTPVARSLRFVRRQPASLPCLSRWAIWLTSSICPAATAITNSYASSFVIVSLRPLSP